MVSLTAKSWAWAGSLSTGLQHIKDSWYDPARSLTFENLALPEALPSKRIFK
jgi:hypothetical protein